MGHTVKHTSIKVVRDYDRALPNSVHGSELNQVWTNLVRNAIDALGESGTITIAAPRRRFARVVDVSDDGPGIYGLLSPAHLRVVFTTKEAGKGTGIGLDLARRIDVDRHDGTLTVDSEPGSTTFHVSLPFSQH